MAVLLAMVACKASFDVAPTEVPKLGSGVVHTLDGEEQEVPETWTAIVVPHHPPGTMWVRDAATGEGRDESRVRFSKPAEAGLGPLGTGLDAAHGTDATQSTKSWGAPGLWVRDEDSRIVEIPLVSIERVHVREPGIPGGAIAGIVIGSAAFAAMTVVAAILLANAAQSSWKM
jgi:hypothetical protein